MDDQDTTRRADDGPTPPPPQGDPYGTTPPRRVRRDTNEGMLGGVAAGLARHLDVDVVWVRLAFVLAAVFANGLGLVAYIAAWIIIPAGDDRDARASGTSKRSDANAGTTAGRVPDGARGARFWAGVGLIGLGSVVLIDRLLSPLQARLGWISPSQLLVPLALIVIGALLWRTSRSDLRLDGATIERDVERFAERVEHEAETAAARLERWVDDGGAVPDTPPPGSPGSPGSPAHPPSVASSAATDSRSTPATLGIALVAAGSVWLLSGFGVSGATFTRALAAALLVVGGGLVVSAFIGRGRGLIGTGLILTPIVLMAILAGPAHVGMRALGFGDDAIVVTDPEAVVEERPIDLASVRDSYTFGVGSIVLDLSAIDAGELAAAGTTRITVELGVGDLLVMLPEDVTVVASVELGVGQVDLAGRTSGGLGVSATRTLVGTSDAAGTIVIDIEQGIGRVRVTR
jgi:phage shock protein PspC (stress-responsive transcriptional regulator)